jgi:enamine deaminase RidA (YjgF/YER057c/UK114 family)
MPAQLVRVPALFPEAPYAYASIAPPGSLVFTAGACPIDETGVVTDPGDFSAQTKRVIANLRAALAAVGASLDDVLKTTVYVASADRGDLLDVWQLVQAAFGAHDAPSTLLGVTLLGYTGQLVEIEAVAVGRAG